VHGARGGAPEGKRNGNYRQVAEPRRLSSFGASSNRYADVRLHRKANASPRTSNELRSWHLSGLGGIARSTEGIGNPQTQGNESIGAVIRKGPVFRRIVRRIQNSKPVD
jgi:hypothetical protein